MEYAIQLLLPILGGLWLGNWLSKTYHLSSLWTLALAFLGMVCGLGILYKRSLLSSPPKSITIRPIGQPKTPVPRQKNSGGLPISHLDFMYTDNPKQPQEFNAKSEGPDGEDDYFLFPKPAGDENPNDQP